MLCQQIYFNAYFGGIAIDQVELVDCKKDETQNPYNSPKSLECSFEKDFCSYNASSDILNIGLKTPSRGTGPQTPFSGKFCFYEATVGKKAPFAMLRSPVVKFEETSCLSFVYHMYGRKVGVFTVRLMSALEDDQIEETTILNETGNQGNIWKKFNYTIKYDEMKSVCLFFC